jgi:hypothetical protein
MTKRQEGVLALTGLLGVCMLLDGCGKSSSNGGDAGASTSVCGTFTGCGGSIVGTWRVSSICLDAPQGYPSCPGFQHSGQLEYSGIITFSSNGTYTSALAKSGNLVSTYPTTCLAGTTCAQLSSSLFKPDSGYSGSCSSNADACVCTAIYAGPEDEQGTYTVEGSSIIMSSARLGGDQGQFCVQGNQLTIRSSSTSSPDSATIIATKE